MSLNSAPTALPVASGTEMDRSPGTGMNMNPSASMRMSGDGGMIGTIRMGNDNQHGTGAETGIISPPNEIITLPKSVIYPPGPEVKPPPPRYRPDGCKTVFVDRLPDKTTEEIIREIFERCGEISVIRMSGKSYCHVRFTEEFHVDNAVKFSGYKLKIENKDGAAYCNNIHVDFAFSRDDHYEFESRQRLARRVSSLHNLLAKQGA